MSDFVRKPLMQQLNKDNPITRIEKLESGDTVKTSAVINDISQLSSNLGEMAAGKINFYNPTTGQLVGYLTSIPDPAYPNYYMVALDSAGNVQFSVDPSTSGATTMGNGAVTINENGVTIANGKFLNFAGTGSSTDIYITAAGDVFYLASNVVGGYFRFVQKLTDLTSASLYWREDTLNANVSHLVVGGGTAGVKISIEGSMVIWAQKDGTETVFNEDSYDIDFRVEGATNANLLKLDAGLDAIGIGKAATSDNLMDVNGSINLVTGNTYKINGTAHTHNYTDVIAGFWNSVTVPASTTYYGAPFKVGVDATAHQVPWAEGGTLSNMNVRISTNQPASGSLVITLQVNGVDTTLVVTIAAGTVGNTTVSDTTHSVAFSASDTLRWKVVNNATGASAALTSVTMINTKATV